MTIYTKFKREEDSENPEAANAEIDSLVSGFLLGTPPPSGNL